jgi:hypothetical protein
MNTNTVRLLFRSAAIFNWSAVLLFLPVPGLAQRFGVDPAPTGTIFELAAFAAIFAFGIGYWRVAGAPEKYEGLVRTGMLAKLLVVAVYLHLSAFFWLSGERTQMPRDIARQAPIRSPFPAPSLAQNSLRLRLPTSNCPSQ